MAQECDDGRRAILFVVPGPPQPKQRARRGKGGRWYTPAKTKRYERAVAEVAAVEFYAWQSMLRETWPTDSRYRLEVHCYFPDARHRDADNVLKAVSDALNKLAWADDSQVMVCTAIRDFDHERPRTEVRIEVLS